jgi:hypothetical protein
MQALSRREENEVMDQAKAEATAACQDTIKGTSLCSTPCVQHPLCRMYIKLTDLVLFSPG